MPRINRQMYARTETYKAAMAESAAQKEDNDCFPRAVWLATGCCRPYSEILAMFAEEGRKPKRGTFDSQGERVLQRLGFIVSRSMGRSAIIEQFVRRYPSPHCHVLKSATTHHMDRFNDVWADGCSYIIFTSGHAAAVIDGVLHDHNRGKATRIKSLWQIVKR